MNNINISRCAVAGCGGLWHKMGEGKLFLFHVKKLSVEGREPIKAWLCENCFDSWVVTLDEDGMVVLSPRQRTPSYVSLSQFAASQRNQSSLMRRPGGVRV
jgi:hypothetical protein